MRPNSYMKAASIAGICFVIVACSRASKDGGSNPIRWVEPDSTSGRQPIVPPSEADLGYVQYPINPWLPLGGLSFGRWREYHGYHVGDDCVRPAGTPVYAIYGGYVQYARYKGGDWGYMMVVESMIGNTPFATVYGHLGSIMYPGEGRWVSKGQYIGTVGATWESGQSTPHLHLGIKYLPYRTATGQYPVWCKGYTFSSSEMNTWFNPTSFISYW